MNPVVKAFTTSQPASMLRLPDYSRAMRAYLDRWEQVGVTPETVHAFSRKSRAVLALPLVLLDQPIGVLCIDLMAGLGGQEKLVGAMFETVGRLSGYFIAALLHLRSA